MTWNTRLIMKELLDDIFGYWVFFYTLALIASYLCFSVLAYLMQRRYRSDKYTGSYTTLKDSPFLPGVSIVASAYNEEDVIVECVESFLRQKYPKFEVIIVNDGSKDKTLENLIKHFSLVEVPYMYHRKVYSKPVHRVFRSANPMFECLTVVDKENGGTKADAINAGLNVVKYPYFVNTDVDCILSEDAILKCIAPVLNKNNVIAVSGAMAMNNGCKIEHGEIKARKIPKTPAPLFQAVEYLRSFFVGKMAWSYINAMPNVSGGYGLFSTEIVIQAGGYSSKSFAEDMDMLIRMIGYCCDSGREYRVEQIPETCCWTQGPPNLKVLHRQRVRWGRGLIQTLFNYSKMIFNPAYKRLGMITLPYITVFEFLAPFIEFTGLIMTVYYALTGVINWSAVWIILASVAGFCWALVFITCFYDYISGITYGKKRSYIYLLGATFLEPLLYHPLIVLFSLEGYFNYLIGKKASWGVMSRKKYSSGKQADPPSERKDMRNLTDNNNNEIPTIATAPSIIISGNETD